MSELNILLTGLVMGESPRWHEGRLWVSDMGAGEVVAVDPQGRSEVIAKIPAMPMGMGRLPDDSMLIVSSLDGQLLRRAADGSLSTHADLTGLSQFPWSDMVVDRQGNAYLGNIGFDFAEGNDGTVGTVALVTPDGVAREVARDFAFPNGMAITRDGSTLIVAESYAHQLTAFDIAADGSLANRRVWADLGDGVPDGICLDAQGAVWYADVPNKRCVRVSEGGEVLQTIEVDRGCFACALDGRTLFITAAIWQGPESLGGGERTGQVLTIDVAVPGIGSSPT